MEFREELVLSEMRREVGGGRVDESALCEVWTRASVSLGGALLRCFLPEWRRFVRGEADVSPAALPEGQSEMNRERS